MCFDCFNLKEKGSGRCKFVAITFKDGKKCDRGGRRQDKGNHQGENYNINAMEKLVGPTIFHSLSCFLLENPTTAKMKK